MSWKRAIQGLKLRIVAGAAVGMLGIPAATWAVSAPVLGDAWTLSSKPTANKGKAKLLEVDTAKAAYVQFDLSTLGSCSGGTVSKATLGLFVKKLPAAGTLGLYLVTEAWDELTINAGSAPAQDPTPFVTLGLDSSSLNNFVTVDVTSTVQGWCDTPANNHGLALVAEAPLSVKFDSKESTSTSHAPQLEVVLSVPGTNITGANVVDGSLTSADIDLGSITTLTGANVADGSLTSADIDLGSITTLTGANVADGSLGNVDINFESDINNIAVGPQALSSITTGANNMAVGDGALNRNTSGDYNEAVGNGGLYYHQTGDSNTAVGQSAMANNQSGSRNTVLGAWALFSNPTVSDNTAIGYSALRQSNAATVNTAVGSQALAANTSGNNNTALGYNALTANDDGSSNTAVGYIALETNVSGDDNTAMGRGALNATTGDGNTAVGRGALSGLGSGTNNTAIGYQAGSALTSGDNNVYVGQVSGVAASESNTIRIGNNSTAAAYVRGIYGVAGSGNTVIATSSGQLVAPSSSRRYKEDIRSMTGTEALLRLRPVTFRYKHELDPEGIKQYGLIAEEVAEVMPELVNYDKQGRPESIRYNFLAPLLLNELQKQHHEQEALRLDVAQQQQTLERQLQYIAEQNDKLQRVEAENAALRAQVEDIRTLKARVAAVEAALPVAGAGNPIHTAAAPGY